ncbi:MAG: hypothetical protein KA712_01040 [Myxococcales bacterium]|nr:hypothetical protein [Myxococcales bacterium]
MAAGRKIRNEDEAQEYLAAAKLSRVSIGDWARARGIDGRSLHAWVMALERRTPQSRGQRRVKGKMVRPALVELVPAPPRGTVGTARYVVKLAAGRVEFGDDASMVLLRQVIEVLRSC